VIFACRKSEKSKWGTVPEEKKREMSLKTHFSEAFQPKASAAFGWKQRAF
jgi:hypothetical protein